MRQDNIYMLQDTLKILNRGYYYVDNKRVGLKLTRGEMEEAYVFLPEDVRDVTEATDFTHMYVSGRCLYECRNLDSFSAAREINDRMFYGLNRPVLVLNFANPVYPGGGVRQGATAQEEDLCRKSSLLLSLEGQGAAGYYNYNRSLGTYMGSDALILHPQVEIIKDENGNLLKDSVVVAVITCAAPMIGNGLGGMSREEYEKLLLRRITGILKVAAYYEYKRVVLGAFGCGAFGNDARTVSDIFYKALKEFDFDGMRERDMFNNIYFAVLDRTREQYNFNEFSRNFSNFYRDEDQAETERALNELKAAEIHLDAARGCIFGGAVGDALGYPVEFLSEEEIYRKYGSKGITSYEKDRRTGKALISDDTQMTLFTANGLMIGNTRGAMRGIRALPRYYVETAYLDWLITQESSFDEYRGGQERHAGGSSWLLDIPELYDRRSPGNTCLSALKERADSGVSIDDFVEAKRNRSKGCGGVMRVAPLAVDSQTNCANMETLGMEGAQLAAITHGHSLGYMPAAVLVHVLNRIIYPPDGEKHALKDIVLEARDTAAGMFAGDSNLPELIRIINLAVSLSEGGSPTDLDNIHQIGEGWVAEETLGIALYCALKYQDDFSAGVTAAVNHKGDSDSTGAVTGNILGAWLGYQAIEDKWKKDLELGDIILEIADDLCRGCRMSESSSFYDPDWAAKYMKMRYPGRRSNS